MPINFAYHARVALCRPTHKSACVSSLLLTNVTKSKEIQTLTSDLAAVINNSLVTSLQNRFQLIIMPFNLHGPEWLSVINCSSYATRQMPI